MSLDLGRYYQVSDPNGAGVGDFLTELHKYDPNASYVPIPQSTNSEGVSNGTIYQLSFNPSKLPGVDGTGSLSQATSSLNGQYGGGPNFFQGDAGGTVVDPSKTVHSPVYGDVNTFGNIKLPETHSWLDYSPLLVLAAGGALGGFGAGGLLGAGGGDAAAGGAGFDFGAGAAGTDAGNAIGLSGGAPGFDFGAGASGTDVGNAIGLDGNYPGFQYGMGDRGLGTTTGVDANTTGVLSQDEINALGPGNGFGMHDRGLGTTTGTEAGTTGVLSPEEIAGLSPSLLSTLASKIPGLLQKIPGLLGSGAGTGAGAGGGSGGGGNLLINAGGQQQRPQTEDAAAILARLYGQHAGLLGARNG